MAPKSGSPFRLVVEGEDDKHATLNLLRARGYDWDLEGVARPYVHPAGGVDEALQAIEPGHKTYQRFGLVIDADLEPSNRWQSIRDRLVRLGYEVPLSPPSEGYVAVHTKQSLARVGVWLMPNNQNAGTLEDFLSYLVPQDDPCWGHATASTHAARSLGAGLKEKDALKGILHAWLAWQDVPGRPFGVALSARFLSPDSPRADTFVAWFNRLFAHS
jgi:hypothetical protein